MKTSFTSNKTTKHNYQPSKQVLGSTPCIIKADISPLAVLGALGKFIDTHSHVDVPTILWHYLSTFKFKQLSESHWFLLDAHTTCDVYRCLEMPKFSTFQSPKKNSLTRVVTIKTFTQTL